MLFTDDNLIGHSTQERLVAAELFTGMIKNGLSKKWLMQTSVNAADDELSSSLRQIRDVSSPELDSRRSRNRPSGV